MVATSLPGGISDSIRSRIAAIGVLGGLAVSVPVPTGSVRWAFAVGVWVAVVGYAYARSGRDRDAETGSPRERLVAANVVTLFRGWLLALFAGIVLASPASVSVGVFVCAVALDVADGAIARRTRVTTLGTRLDGAVDALAVLVGAAATVAIGSLPPWYLLAGGAWYGYSAALLFRARSDRPVYDLPESRLRPLIGGAQFLVVSIALWVKESDPLLVTAAAVAMGALLVSFARDWAAATGRLERIEGSIPGSH